MRILHGLVAGGESLQLIILGFAITLVDALCAWRGGSVRRMIVIHAGFQAIGFAKDGLFIELQGIIGQGLAEKRFPDGAGDVAPVIGPVFQVNKAVVAANPDAGHQLGGIAHEPEIRIIVRRAGLSAHFG
jgi:hypothetical protein